MLAMLCKYISTLKDILEKNTANILHHLIATADPLENNDEFIKHLITEYKIPTYQTNSDKQTPLDYAVLYQHFETVKYLSNFADLEMLRSAAMYAVKSDNVEILEYLFDRIEKQGKCEKEFLSKLLIAARSPFVTDYLIKKGADVNFVDENENTALACSRSKTQFNLLLENGAKIDTQRKDGISTVLYHFLKNNSLSMFMYAHHCGAALAPSLLELKPNNMREYIEFNLYANGLLTFAGDKSKDFSKYFYTYDGAIFFKSELGAYYIDYFYYIQEFEFKHENPKIADSLIKIFLERVAYSPFIFHLLGQLYMARAEKRLTTIKNNPYLLSLDDIAYLIHEWINTVNHFKKSNDYAHVLVKIIEKIEETIHLDSPNTYTQKQLERFQKNEKQLTATEKMRYAAIKEANAFLQAIKMNALNHLKKKVLAAIPLKSKLLSHEHNLCAQTIIANFLEEKTPKNESILLRKLALFHFQQSKKSKTMVDNLSKKLKEDGATLTLEPSEEKVFQNDFAKLDTPSNQPFTLEEAPNFKKIIIERALEFKDPAEMILFVDEATSAGRIELFITDIPESKHNTNHNSMLKIYINIIQNRNKSIEGDIKFHDEAPSAFMQCMNHFFKGNLTEAKNDFKAVLSAAHDQSSRDFYCYMVCLSWLTKRIPIAVENPNTEKQFKQAIFVSDCLKESKSTQYIQSDFLIKLMMKISGVLDRLKREKAPSSSCRDLIKKIQQLLTMIPENATLEPDSHSFLAEMFLMTHSEASNKSEALGRARHHAEKCLDERKEDPEATKVIKQIDQLTHKVAPKRGFGQLFSLASNGGSAGAAGEKKVERKP